MISLEQIKHLAESTPSKIIFLVMDGLGGLPHPDTGKTELESARRPNLDRLARDGISRRLPIARPTSLAKKALAQTSL